MERPSLLNTGLLSLILMAMVFAFVFWQVLALDLEHTARLGRILNGHLLYTLRLKDDMGSIDWGKSLEALPGIKGFSVTKDNNEIVSGGNRQLIPGPGPEGARFQFPDQIMNESYLTTDGAKKVRFALLSEPFLDPWKAAGLSTLLIPVVGSFFWFISSKKRSPGLADVNLSQRTSKVEIVDPGQTSPALPKTKSVPIGGLLIDPQFKILQLGPSTPELLGLSPSDLLNGHLLDLFPDPSLLQAIEKKEKQKVIGAFPKAPGMTVRLEPVPQGFLLVLEREDSSQTPKNP